MTTISQERSKLAALGVELRRREQWGARFNYTNSRPVDEPATRVFVHITVTEPGNYASFDAHARAIENIGINRFPNTGISYNRLFMAGTRNVYEGQPIGRRGAHTVNDFRRSTCTTSGCPNRGGPLTAPSWNLNINARSYVYCANVHHSVPDHVVDDMARVIAADKLAGFVAKNAQIHGHRCVSSKSCPGDKMWARMGELDKQVNHYLSTGLDGGTMSWQENLEPTATAANRFPDSYSTRADRALMHILGIVYANTYGKIKANAWMRERWPNIPEEGYSPRVYWRSGYGEARAAKEEAIANGKQIAQLAARQSAMESLLQQLLDTPGQPVDMAAVSAAALAGAQQAMAELDIRVTINPAEEPTEP